MVLNLYDFIQSSPWPEEWLEKMTESMNIPDGTDFGKTLWGSVLLSSVKIGMLQGWRNTGLYIWRTSPMLMRCSRKRNAVGQDF